MLRVRVMTRLLVTRTHKECVSDNARLDRSIGTRGRMISGVGTVGTGSLSGGEKLRGRLSIGSMREVDTILTNGSTSILKH